MGTKGDGSELVQNRSFQSLLERMDDDADAADKKWKNQVADKAFADLPPNYLSQYKTDDALMNKARGNFNLEWNKIVAGKGDPRKLLAAYDAYSGNLEALWESNARFEALIDVDVGVKAEAMLLVLMAMSKNSLAYQLQQQLKKLEAALKKAQDEVSDAKLKRVLNVALSAVTLVIAPESALVRAGVAAGAITGHIIIDNAFGKGSAKGTVVFVVGDGVEAIEKLDEAGKKFVGAAAAVVTFKFDSDEVGEAEQVVEEIRPEIAETLQMYNDLMAGMLPLVPKLRQLDATIKALARDINQALTKSADAAKNYDSIKSAIKKTL